MISLPTPNAVPVPTCAFFAEPRLLRDLLAHWLSVHGRVSLVHRSGDVADMRAALDRHRPDLLIVAAAEGTSGPLDVVRHFVTVRPQGRVLAVAASGDAFVAPTWLGDRLVASFDASAPPAALGAALDALVASSEAEATAAGATTARARGKPLSAQESRVLDLIAAGHTSRSIAASLGISEHTVRSHRKRITAKLGLAGTRLMHRAVLLRRTTVPDDRNGA